MMGEKLFPGREVFMFVREMMENDTTAAEFTLSDSEGSKFTFSIAIVEMVDKGEVIFQKPEVDVP